MSTSVDYDSTGSLPSDIDSLRKRVKELEEENAKLLHHLSECCCNEKLRCGLNDSAATGKNLVDGNGELIRKDCKPKKKKVYSTGSIEHLPTRHVALRVIYFGQRFYGFASESQMDPTVESELFKALEKTRLLVGDRKKSQYSRCGRTDKGVSAFGQVIALFLRSKLKGTTENNKLHHEFSQQDGEIDYVRLLNRALPYDIRVTGWSPVPVDFSARFSCLAREYKYFFWRGYLNISAMEYAGKKFIGEHDFRNFCKMDALNVHNYCRQISSFELLPCNKSFEGNQLWVIKVKGSAFLWHQVRCMVAVLFMVGQGLESPEIIDVLLSTSSTQRKPQYTMAPEVPLVLQSCQFEGLRFTCSSDAFQALCVHLENECRAYELQAAIHHEALQSLLLENGESSLGSRMGDKVTSHIPLMSRPTEPSYEERRAKLKLGEED
ncbi:hypothetical protein SAY87_000209 [Trapa incisa]|uniref:Pseudouridine synthase I TruA alpha/beta domain-containing protein n=1 Tax=Trapa incisa TaxID=236973 RepID=A0AAN7JH00_9MYRT|nr:hypothetical protein SAY87_000209 [Trapa incisa]